jgi:hypothetical protein
VAERLIAKEAVFEKAPSRIGIGASLYPPGKHAPREKAVHAALPFCI